MRRTIRALLWTVKAVLLAIALGAVWVWAWAWSWKHPGQVSAGRFIAETQRVECLGYHAGCGAGRIALGRMSGSCASGPWLEEGRATAASAGPGWQYDVWRGGAGWGGVGWATDGRAPHRPVGGAAAGGCSGPFYH